MADWLAIKNEYINTNISYRKLAEKHNVSFATLQLRAKKEQWKNERDKQYDKTTTKLRQKTANVIVKKEVDRMTKIISLADKLSEKLESSIDELDTYIVKNKTKTKTVEYATDNAFGKPIKEVVHENENIEIVPGNIDRQGLKMLTAALKDIKDIQISGINASLNETEDDPITKALKETFGDGK